MTIDSIESFARGHFVRTHNLKDLQGAQAAVEKIHCDLAQFRSTPGRSHQRNCSMERSIGEV